MKQSQKIKAPPIIAVLLFALSIGTFPLAANQNILPPVQRRRAASAQEAKVVPPKLIVYIVVDQFRAEFLTRFMPWFGTGGFRALIREGAYFTNANYSHGATYTGPGHAAIASGAYGAQHGIITNKWYNRAKGKSEAMVYDPDHSFIGIDNLTVEDENSPANFIGTTLGDQMLLANSFQSKSLTIAIKDRGAICLGGRLGKAYWFSEVKGEFLTSTYYMKSLPDWVKEFNSRRIADTYFGKSWERLPEPKLFAALPDDDYKFEMNPFGNGREFPHKITGKLDSPGSDYYEAFEHTPWANDLTFAFARAAVENENLGTDEFPDFLGISLTANDYVGHAYGPNSHEAADITVRSDRQIADFIAYLEKKFSPNELLIVLTADHGAGAIPEYMAQLNLNGARIKKKKIKETIEAALDARYGAADWVAALEDPNIYLHHQPIDDRKLSHEEVERAAGEALKSITGVEGYLTRTQLINGALPQTRLASAYRKSFHPDRSGDVVLILKPFYMWGKYAEKDDGTTHGSPYSYDTHVPLIIRGSGVKPGVYQNNVDVTDLAPTVASILKINPPAACQGRVLAEALR